MSVIAPVIAIASSARPAIARRLPPNTIRSLSCSRNSIRWCAVGAIRHARGRGGAQERHEVDRLLEARDVREALVERDDEQEGEQHLDARKRHAQLTEQLLEVAIEPLLLGLVVVVVLPLRRVHALIIGARPPDGSGRALSATWSGTSTRSRSGSRRSGSSWSASRSSPNASGSTPCSLPACSWRSTRCSWCVTRCSWCVTPSSCAP